MSIILYVHNGKKRILFRSRVELVHNELVLERHFPFSDTCLGVDIVFLVWGAGDRMLFPNSGIKGSL